MTPVAPDRIRVAIVDDSSFIRLAVVRMLADDPRLEIAGTAATGEELLEHFAEWRPDVVTLDLSMPGIGGLRTLDLLMARHPTPVIILSSHSKENAPQTIEALHRGAVDFIDKQRYSLVDFEALRQALLEKILEVTRRRLPPRRDREAAGADAAPVARRRARPRPAPAPGPAAPAATAPLTGTLPRLLLIGASTGGPPAIQTVLQDLGPDLRQPVALVQHMPRGFTRAYAERLNAHLTVPVREATDGERLLAPTVYLAPAGLHLRIEGTRDRLYASLSPKPEQAAHRPSVDVLFASAQQILGDAAVAVLLTGMGRDGARGMADLATAGAMTIAQDEATSVVYGMPRAAAELGAAREVLPLDQIGARLRELL